MGGRSRSVFVCTECGAEASKWIGQCSECGAWNTLQEAPEAATGPRTGQPSARFGSWTGESRIQRLPEVGDDRLQRIASGLPELDHALGGGIVPGSVILIGGDPGIGKSTLLAQLMGGVAGRLTSVYVSGEESLEQVAARVRRLGLGQLDVALLSETRVERILALAADEQPGLLLIDSIQTMHSDGLHSAPGAVAQVRESTALLVRYAKQTGTAVVLVGHVTKEGTLAGPRVLEHMVDTVLYFEGEADGRYRMVRAVKNRYGAVNELGVFAMTERGLREVSNPSAIFLARGEHPAPGSVVLATLEGTRPLLVEVQALVDLAHSGQPRRVTVGLEPNRLIMLLAVASRHAGIAMADHDVFINVVGGLRVSETASDLAMLAACASSLHNRPLEPDLVLFGEVGLAGEVRPVPNGEARLREAAKQGLRRAIVPAANRPRRGVTGLDGLSVAGVNHLSEALDEL